MSIPIIGQPEIKDWQVAAAIKCPCGETLIVTGRAGWTPPKKCACGRVYVLNGMPQIDPRTGDVAIPLAMGRETETQS